MSDKLDRARSKHRFWRDGLLFLSVCAGIVGVFLDIYFFHGSWLRLPLYFWAIAGVGFWIVWILQDLLEDRL